MVLLCWKGFVGCEFVLSLVPCFVWNHFLQPHCVKSQRAIMGSSTQQIVAAVVAGSLQSKKALFGLKSYGSQTSSDTLVLGSVFVDVDANEAALDVSPVDVGSDADSLALGIGLVDVGACGVVL